MSNLPPPAVLAKRLEHELRTIRLYADAENRHLALRHVAKAERLLAQLQEAMR